MPTVTFVSADGDRRILEAREGETLMSVAVRNGVPGIEGECGGELSCGTCHVHVAEDWSDRLKPASDDETDMLEVVDSPSARSRLCCQIRASSAVDGLVLEVPA